MSTEIVVDSPEVELDETAGDRFGDWVVEDNPRLKGFVDFLETHPGSGTTHEVGADILAEVGRLTTCDAKGYWWRARSIPKADCPPPIAKLGPPPRPSSTGGRFNSPGQLAFYLAAERDSAIAESRKYQKSGEEIWVLRYRVEGMTGVANLVAPAARSDAFRNLSLPTVFAGLLWCDGLVQQGDKQAIKREYALAQFVADCAISKGIMGFKINSKLHTGSNLVLFSWDDRSIKPLGQAELGEAAK